jgi:hypothetical protein
LINSNFRTAAQIPLSLARARRDNAHQRALKISLPSHTPAKNSEVV